MAVAAAIASPRETERVCTREQLHVVRTWLYGLAVLVMLMVAVGGATRLTGSGLSITEWRPVTGAVPPLSSGAWETEFARYRESSQYRNLNDGMTLGEFQSIYWWEWSHRQLGRFVGLYALGPLLWFWWRRTVSTRLALKLLGIAALGGLQAGIGWVMVASGLEAGMVAVAPVKLTLHLLGAALILGAIVWVAAGLGSPKPARTAFPGLAAVVLALVGVQVGLGGLVAGSRAGLTYNTWPSMDGQWLPSADTLFPLRPWLDNLVAAPALVQFDHRATAYLVVAAVLAQTVMWLRADPGSPGARRSAGLAALALAQVGLGIATLLWVVPLALALAHQLLAMALLATATIHLRLTRMERSATPQPLTRRS